jgi:membrane protein implicated in regulation of membrane protease activity|tara:strand:+ start:1024 stop:1326 length:303 start_codon:yes stop_codon:yes gene_type:complete
MITFLFFLPQTWIILGILLIIADIFLGYDFFVLPVGVSALIISLILYLQTGSFEEMGDFILFNTWHDVAYWFSGLSLVSIILMRLLFKLRKKDRIDINEY